jgi:hypothetical protein
MPASVLDSLPGESARAGSVAAVAAELVACGSLEMGAEAPEDARRIAELLPAGTPVYVNHLPRHELPHTLAALVALREAGLEPVPHIAARRVASRPQVRAFLDQAVRVAGVAKALLIAGDVRVPVGPYADSAALIRDGVLAESGLQQVGLPGYPEGHPQVATAALNAALGEKLALLAEQRLAAYVVTQFSYAPGARCPGLCGARRTDDAAPADQVCATLWCVGFAQGVAGGGYAGGAPVYPRRSQRPAHRNCASRQ